jgi:type I restriction enzyme, S subunit
MEDGVREGVALPDGWKQTTLGAIGRYLNGRAFKTSEWVKTGRRPIIRIQDLTGSNRNPNYYDGAVEDRYVVLPGDFLISWSATLGAYIWDGPEAVLNQHIFKVQSKINKRFHYYLVRDRIAELERNAHGSGMVHVTKGIFESTPVAVPKDERVQEQIAALIDSIESKQLSSARHLSAARRAVERFRQAVLAAACVGQLTAAWRDEQEEVDDVAKTLQVLRARAGWFRERKIDPYLDLSKLAGLPPNWTWAALGEVAEVQIGGTPSRNEASYWKGDVPWVSSGEVANCRISHTRERITEAGLANSSAKLYPTGTVLIAMIGEGKTRGQSAILDIKASTNQNAAGVLSDREIVSPEYVWRWALAQYEVTRAIGRGGNQPALNGQKVRELTIPLPPRTEQEEIIQRVDQLLAFSDGLKQRIEAASTRIERSSEAVLAKAFRGELSPGDPLALGRG